MNRGMNYTAPRWLPGGQLQTIWPALCSRRGFGRAPSYLRQRWDTPDGDLIDVDFLKREPAADGMALARPMLVVFHGLEGSSRSHYSEAFADLAAELGWDCALPHFRGCSGEINRAPRAYHSGDHAEIDWILKRLRRAYPGVPLMAVGISLGGNALLRWAGEVGQDAGRWVHAIAGVCAPIDLAAGGYAIGRGFNRQVYNRMFMRTLVPKALQKLAQHPGLFDRQALLAARDLYAFDNVFTAPLHGFQNTEDYWHRASAKPLLGAIRVPALVVNPLNDPFVPGRSLPGPRDVSSDVTLWQPAHGGHVGFASGRPPGHVRAMPDAVAGWLATRAGLRAAATAKSPHGRHRQESAG